MQANRFNVPRIGFINKLDRPGSEVATTVESVKRRLKVEPMLVNIPCDESHQLQGLIDLPSMTYFKFNDEMGQYVDIEQVDGAHPLFKRSLHYRNQLIEQLSLFDEEIADAYIMGLEPENFEQGLIEAAVKKAIKTQKAVALFCGSALKNKGIQALIDGVVKYLPSP